MSELLRLDLRPPYLLMTGELEDIRYAKTAAGIVQWRPEHVAGQLRFPESALDLGVAQLTIEQAITRRVGSLIVGIAPVGGQLSKSWHPTLTKAAAAGIDIISGLHSRLTEIPGLLEAAQNGGARLIDVRTPPSNLPVGNGQKRSGHRVLTVGTDCAVGKKFTALALHRSLKERGVASDFRATGQTGIIIAGEGMPIDCVPADFIAGAAELLSPDNDITHWDVIEGQGSLFHPGFAGVTLGLVHGSQPDALVLCHEASRDSISTFPHIKIPKLIDCIDSYIRAARLTNPKARCVGLSVNTSRLPEPEREAYLQERASQLGLPCVDPLVTGCEPLARALAG